MVEAKNKDIQLSFAPSFMEYFILNLHAPKALAYYLNNNYLAGYLHGVLLLKNKAEMIPDKPDTDNTGVGMHGQDCL